MAIIKQTDTPTEGANVYADVNDLEDFALLRNIDLSAYEETTKEAALYISAQDWVDGEHNFKGEIIDPTQKTKLPTDQVLINDDITTANCMTAIQQLKGLLFVEAKSADSLGQVVSTMKKLDKLEIETEYAEGSNLTAGSSFNSNKAENKLKPYLSFGAGGVLLFRG